MQNNKLMFSMRFKESFKVALAMLITYGIALSMDWDKPFWAGLTVAFCSLATAGESIKRGMDRTLGTILAGVVTVCLVALFPQDRWLFLISMSAIIAFCTYQLSSGSRHFFIWFTCGFTIPILAFLGGGMSLSSFNIIILRVEETALGVIIYSLVALFVWPQRGGLDFENNMRQLLDAQYRLIQHYLKILNNSKPAAAGNIEQLRTEISQRLAGLEQRLDGAARDSDDIWLARHAWHRYLRSISELGATMASWRIEAMKELATLDLQQYIRGISSFCQKIDTRFKDIDLIFTNQIQPNSIDKNSLSLEHEQLLTLPAFQRIAVINLYDRLLQLDQLSRKLMVDASAIRGLKLTATTETVQAERLRMPVIDRDRLDFTIRQTSALWLALLMAIYVPAFPNIVATVALANAFSMILATAPFVQPALFFMPTLLGSVFAGILYMFVMPHLSDFWQIGTLIFAATFFISYVFHQPKMALMKSMGLCMLVLILGVQNRQNFNFLYFSTWLITGIIFVLTMMLAWRFPISFRIEDRFLVMLNRYFYSAQFLISHLTNTDTRRTSWLHRRRLQFHLHEVAVLPQRLHSWGRALSPAARGKTRQEDIQALINSMQLLSDQIQALMKTKLTRESENVANKVLAEIKQWSADVKNVFQTYAHNPESYNDTQFETHLQKLILNIEDQLIKTLSELDSREVSDEELENIYRLIGLCRYLSSAVISLGKQITPIDWQCLKEARF